MTAEKAHNPAPEVIDVRADEGFDVGRLGAFLAGRLPGSDRALAVRQFAGGHANLTYLLRFGEGDQAVEYVLRRPPLGPVAPGSHDMGREHRALSGLWRAFPLAPRSYVYCDDPEVIGAPFFVMERRHGVVVRGAVPPAFGGGADSEANRKLSAVVVATLAEFHAADPAVAGLETLGRPDGFLRRQVEGWAGRYERAKTGEDPLADELARWLLDHLPESPAPTLLHNDWRLDNMALAPDDPGRCVAVYDWDMCTRGDPLADLGTVLAVWHDPDESPGFPSAMPVQLPGFLSRSEAAKVYAEQSGRDLAALDYYVVFGTFKMAVVLQQIYFRFHRGQTRDERFAGMEQGAKALFQLADARRRPS
jgi:aminoglycoside phosphotransferase (APT) family kinase protein